MMSFSQYTCGVRFANTQLLQVHQTTCTQSTPSRQSLRRSSRESRAPPNLDIYLTAEDENQDELVVQLSRMEGELIEEEEGDEKEKNVPEDKEEDTKEGEVEENSVMLDGKEGNEDEDEAKENDEKLMERVVEKDKEIAVLREDLDKAVEKARSIERLLKSEMEVGDEIRKSGERERQELNIKVQELELEIIKKNGEILQEKEIKEKAIEEKEAKERETKGTKEKDVKIEELLKENRRLEDRLIEKEEELESEGRKGKELHLEARNKEEEMKKVCARLCELEEERSDEREKVKMLDV